jgi:hypothetical protein
MKKEYDFKKAKRGAIVPQKGKTRITVWLEDTNKVQQGGSKQELVLPGTVEYSANLNHPPFCHVKDKILVRDKEPIAESSESLIIRDGPEQMVRSQVTHRVIEPFKLIQCRVGAVFGDIFKNLQEILLSRAEIPNPVSLSHAIFSLTRLIISR